MSDARPPTPPQALTMQVTLTVTAGPHKGRQFTFSGHDTFLVGRSRQAHFRLPGKDKQLSRLHFLVEINPPHCRLVDLGSRNGTFVNDQKVTVSELKDGDQISFGQTTLRVAVEGLPVAVFEPEAAGTAFVPPGLGAEPPAPAARAAPPDPARPAPVASLCGAPAPPKSREVRRPVAAETTAPGARVRGAGDCTRLPPAEADASASGPAEPDPAPNPAQGFPGYQVIRELGRGGTGGVYLARCVADGSLVAVKAITPAVAASAAMVERFLREADILRQLNHANIVAFREMGEAANQLYLVMEYVPGPDARQVLRQSGPLAVGRAVRWTCQVLEALQYAHARGFVHRDIKPANVLIAPAEGREVAKLADFGLARVYQASRLSGLTMAGDVGGTLAFMAPEQITNFRDVAPAADQYGAAAALYYLLTGQFLFDLPTLVPQQLVAILQEEPVPIRSRRPDVPEALADAIHRGLAKEPKDRFPDVGAFRQALLPFAD
jgi:serine/threonine-protein kinase